MTKYDLTRMSHGHYKRYDTIIIEAESKEEAIEIAEELYQEKEGEWVCGKLILEENDSLYG